MSTKPDSNPDAQELPLLSHLIELRDRLIRSVITILVVFLGLFYFHNNLYTYLAEPLMSHLPKGASMIATDVASPFFTPVKLTLVLAIFISVPMLLYQIWSFIAPGLYRHEKRLAFPLLVSSIILFYVGMAFAYFVVFPLVFKFLTATAPTGVAVMTDISKYLDFVLKLFFAFGVAFEVPIATILLVLAGITDPDSLSAKRPYIIVAAFVIGMLLTPPDIISQTLLAVPMWMLFESGLFFSRMLIKRREEERASEEQQEDEDAEIDPDAELDAAIAEEESLNQDKPKE